MLRKNVSGQFVYFQGVDATTGGIKSGVTWTMRRGLDGTFAAGGGTVTEDGTTGFYKCALTQADTNGNNVGYNFTGSGAVPQTLNAVTTAADPTDAVRFGITALPNAAAEAAGGLYTRGSGAGQINQPANGQIDANVVKWLGTACSTPTVAGVPNVNTKTWNDLATVALPLVPLTAGRALDVTAANKVNGVVLVDTVTTYTGNTVQTGDNFARIGAAGVGLTAVGLTGTQNFNNTGTWTGNIAGTLSTLTTYTGNTPQTGDNYARLGAPAGASISADIAAKPTSAQNATAVFTTALTESYAALHAMPTLAQLGFEIRSLLAEKSVAVTTLTTKKIDGSTTAGTYALDSATAPTQIARAT